MKIKSISITSRDDNDVEDNVSDNKVISAVIEKDDRSIVTLSILESNGGFQNVLDGVTDMQRGKITEDDLCQLIINTVDKSHHVESKFKDLGVLDGRMVRKGSRILVDYEPIDPTLENHIIRILDEGDRDGEWQALAAFIENLYTNTLDYVREQLFGWLNACGDFTITKDGCFIGYKGCMNEDGRPVSINSGFGIVNGEECNGHLDNSVGNIVEMPRNMVQNDPSVGCSTGLHVGTWEYASGFANGFILTVKVNPRDVVSIPEDCAFQKLRCCRYEVLATTVKEIDATTYDYDDDDYPDDDDYYDDEDF